MLSGFEIFKFLFLTTLTLFQPGGGGIHPSRFFPRHSHKNQPIDSKLLTFNFYYRDIIWPKIKLITCQGVTWSLFCRKHFVSPHIFHCIFTEFSCSTFSFFWHLYSVLISVFWWKNILLVIFLWIKKKFWWRQHFRKDPKFWLFYWLLQPRIW